MTGTALLLFAVGYVAVRHRVHARTPEGESAELLPSNRGRLYRPTDGNQE
ncbi:hypothetical protein PNP85_12360 [Halobacterium salinarum]|nr:hypothetical protein [Halobacterium salinarum]MDL0140295.1 hypothetical protein [Halobacterium salinarum]